MAEEVQRSVTDSTTDDEDYPRCPDCDKPFSPGHMCRESMLAGIETSMAAFQIAMKTILMIKEATVYWKKGVEEDLLKAIAQTVRKADKDIRELVEGKSALEESEECTTQPS